ncbi:MAG: general secretion pathway protein GspB [Candidatus Omnitrophica bacterium]|nr:general secretion pathway protein GspB [Candidatus Omnitrophota bacterium]
MDKKKREQVILVVLIPLFLMSLLFMRSQKKPSGEATETAISEVEPDQSLDNLKRLAKVSEVMYKAGSRDPLKDLLLLYLYKEPIKKPDKILPLPSLTISGLIWNTDMPQAIINGKVTKVGDTIEGVKLIAVAKEGITVEYSGEKVIIPKK